jgi:galactokinase
VEVLAVCTINLVKDELYDSFIKDAKKSFMDKYGHEPKVYDVVISDGSRKFIISRVV